MSDRLQRNLSLIPQTAQVTELVLHYVGLMTQQRDRPQLMVKLVEAIVDALEAQSVRLYRLFSPPGARYVGLSVIADRNGLHVRDDNVSWPEGTCPIDQYPVLRACLRKGLMQSERDHSGCHYVFPIGINEGECFGFLELSRADSMSTEVRAIFDGLMRVFYNCVGMLDYSEMDTLTKLLNRKTFDNSLMKVLSRLNDVEFDGANGEGEYVVQRRHLREHHEHWLGVIDIDHFKLINDSFGHLVGDETLLALANMMRRSFRMEDKLFRFGGEEFVVLLTPTEAENAFSTFDRFRREVEAERFPQIGQMTVSIGFACIRSHDAASAILDNADEALYWAKSHGRNQVCSYEELVAYGMLKRKPLPFIMGFDPTKSLP